MDVEPMEMRIRPAKRNLERVVKIGDRAIAAHQQAAPDHRTDLANPHVEPVNLDVELFCHHCLILANSRQNCESITPAPGMDHSLPYKQWPEIFNNDSTLTSAILDRLLHHAETQVYLKNKVGYQKIMLPTEK
jgi:hypothetical protein